MPMSPPPASGVEPPVPAPPSLPPLPADVPPAPAPLEPPPPPVPPLPPVPALPPPVPLAVWPPAPAPPPPIDPLEPAVAPLPPLPPPPEPAAPAGFDPPVGPHPAPTTAKTMARHLAPRNEIRIETIVLSFRAEVAPCPCGDCTTPDGICRAGPDPHDPTIRSLRLGSAVRRRARHERSPLRARLRRRHGAVEPRCRRSLRRAR